MAPGRRRSSRHRRAPRLLGDPDLTRQPEAGSITRPRQPVRVNQPAPRRLWSARGAARRRLEVRGAAGRAWAGAVGALRGSDTQ